MEVARRDDEVVVGTDGGVVGGGVDLDVDHRFHVRERVFHRAMHLWDAAEGVGVLHIHLGLCNHLAAFEQLVHVHGGGYLSLVRAHQVYRHVEGLHAPVESLERHGGNGVGPGREALGLDERPYGQRTHVLCAVEQGEALF